MKKIELTQEQISQILNLYKNNYSQQKIANILEVSRPVIKRVLTENEVLLRERTHKYKADYDIFENIDTPEKAYWLGFIAADGCNYQRENNSSIIISINQKDIDHLEKFKKFVNTNAEIKLFEQDMGYSNKTQMCKIVLNSKKMSNDLYDKGIVPNKSLILDIPKIDEKYYYPFILGYFDGDGSISKTNCYNNYCISFQGTKEILNWINNLFEISKLDKRQKESSKNSYYIRCGGTNKPYNILKQLYDSCEVHLDRKYKLFKALETVVLSRNTK